VAVHDDGRLSRRRALIWLGGTALTAGCGGAGDARGTGGGRVIKVGMLRISPHLMAPRFYARFLPPELQLETIAFNNATEIKNAVITRSIDFAVTGVTAALLGASRGEPVRVLAAAADGASAIVARKAANIRSVADLRGRTIGYVPGSAQDILLRLTLRKAGIDAGKDVQLLKLGFGDMPNALERGDIEAFTGAETGPSVALLRGRAHVVAYPYETAVGKINIVLATSVEMIEREPELCRQVVRVHAQATDYMRTHEAEWAKATSKTWGAKLEAVQQAITNITLRWQLDATYVAQARALGEQLELLKQIKQQPNYDEFFHMQLVRELAETT
jgi:NitT/TauT family transport system substrate-binding protein